MKILAIEQEVILINSPKLNLRKSEHLRTLEMLTCRGEMTQRFAFTHFLII